jgi:hypothetical protein
MVLVEMHEVTLHDALQGLLQYGEDVLDASRRAGAVIVVRQEGAATPLKRASGRADDASRLHIEMLPRSAEPYSSEAVRRWLRALPDDDAPVVLFPQHEPSVP